MKNIKDMDYEVLDSYEKVLDEVHEGLENMVKLIEVADLDDISAIYTKLHLQSYADHIDSKRKGIQEQKKLIQEKADEAYDTLQDLDNSQK